MTTSRRSIIRRRPRNSGVSVAVALLVGALVGAVSCGPNEVVTRIPEDHNRLKAIATVYAYACRDLGRPPKSASELLPTFAKAGVENPRDYLSSTRDGEPYVIIWDVDLEHEYLGSKLLLAYESAGFEGRRLAIACDYSIIEIGYDEFKTLQWPAGHEPEL